MAVLACMVVVEDLFRSDAGALAELSGLSATCWTTEGGRGPRGPAFWAVAQRVAEIGNGRRECLSEAQIVGYMGKPDAEAASFSATHEAEWALVGRRMYLYWFPDRSTATVCLTMEFDAQGRLRSVHHSDPREAEASLEPLPTTIPGPRPGDAVDDAGSSR